MKAWFTYCILSVLCLVLAFHATMPSAKGWLIFAALSAINLGIVITVCKKR